MKACWKYGLVVAIPSLVVFTVLQNLPQRSLRNAAGPTTIEKPKAASTKCSSCPREKNETLSRLCSPESKPILLKASCVEPVPIWPDEWKRRFSRVTSFDKWLAPLYNGFEFCGNWTSEHSCAVGSARLASPCCIHQTVVALDLTSCLLNKFNFTWWLDSGVLIGSLREGRPVFNDYDVDVGVYLDSPEAAQRFGEMVKWANTHKTPQEKSGSDNVTIVRNGRGNVNLVFPHSGMHMDMFQYWHAATPANPDYAKAKKFTNKTGYMFTPNWPDYGKGNESDFFPLSSCSLFGRLFPCPKKPHAHLKRTKDFMKSNLFSGLHIPAAFKDAVDKANEKTQRCLEEQLVPTLSKDENGKKYPFLP